MDIRSLANAATGCVHPNETVRVLKSTGYTVGAGGRQVPAYAAPVDGPASIQALDSDDIQQLANINIQGTYRAIYLRGRLAGVVRPDGTGGDIVGRGVGFAEEWLVVKVLESWPTWTKAAIVLQMPNGGE